MADDKQIELVIRAKNLTDEAFKKVQAAIREVDSTSKATTEKGSTDWKKWFGVIGGGVATGNLLSDAFKKVGAELINLPNKLLELGARGADVNDVKSAFDGLTTSVGQTSAAMLGELRSAFGGTVADFDLMKSANEGLSKGVKFTSDDMGLLAKAARIMADRVGGDAKQSFDSMITGIAEGREKTLRKLPLDFAEIEASVKSYAEGLDLQVSQLDESQKQEALRQAVLKQSARLVRENGEIENDFADKLVAGAATVRNWTDGLAQSVAQHGPMIAGLGGMAQAAATLTPLLGMTGLAGAASALAGVLLSPVGLVAGLGAAAVAFTAIKVSDINAQATAYEQAAQIIGRAANDLKEAQDVLRAFEAGKAGQQMSGDVTTTMAEAWRKGAESAGQLKTAVTELTLEGFGPGVTTTKSYTDILKDLRAEVAKLPQETKNEIDAMRALGKTEDFIREKLNLSASVLKVYTQQTKDHTKALKDLKTESAEIVQRIQEEEKAHFATGLALRKQFNDLMQNIAARRALMALPMIEHFTSVEERIAAATQRMGEMADKGLHLASSQEQTRWTIDQAEIALREEEDAIADLGQAMTNLAQTTKSSFIAAMASVVNAVDAGKKGIDALKGGFDTMTSGKGLSSILSGFTGIVSGIGGIVSAAQAAISIGKALFGIFDRDKGRDAVKAFAAEFSGGFDEIQGYMALLGDEGARMWKTLTQGKDVHSDPKAAQRIIDEVRAAIEKLRREAQNPIDVRVNTHESRSYDDGGEDVDASHDAGAYIRQDHVAKVHAGELIGPVEFMSRALAGAMRMTGGGGGGTVIVQLGTREVARTLMPAVAEEIMRLRLA